MIGRSLQKLLIMVLMLLFAGSIFSATAYAANGGEISAYFGTDTVVTGDENNAATASGNGVGGTVKYGTNNLTNGTNPGYTTASDQELDIIITPAAGYQIVWIKRWRSGHNWSSENVESPATGVTNFERKIEEGRKYWIAVKFEATSTSYNVSYNFTAADNPTGTTCNTTALGIPLSPQVVLKDATISFTFTNSVATCILDSVSFDGGPFTTNGISGNVYTTPAITKNVVVQPRFRGDSYSIVSSVDASGSTTCGTINPGPGTNTYSKSGNESATFTFTPTPIDSCTVESLLVDGVSVSPLPATDSYTFSNISANHTIMVKYKAVPPFSGSGFCHVPAFMGGQNVLKPNVLIIFDTSGSMSDNPYSGMTYNCTETGATSTLAGCTNYYGYFEKNKMYTLSSSKYTIDSSTALNLASATGTGTGKGMSGNYLNFTQMRKVDVIRKILVGGQVATGTGYSARGSATGGGNTRFLLTEGGKYVEYGTTDPTGVIQSIYAKVRFGLMVFNPNGSAKAAVGGGDGGRIVAPFGTSEASLVATIEGNITDPGGWTPLAESLYEATRYFRGATSAYNSGVDYGNTTDFPVVSPYSRHAIQASCQKHFVLVITDGEPTNDTNVPAGPGSNTNITDTNFSDWWTTVNASTTKPTTLMGAVGYYAHTKDMLDLTKNPTDISSINNLTVFTVFTFDSSATGVTTLKQTAKFGSFEDTATSLNAKPDVASEWSSDGGTTTNNYYQADNGEVLQESISGALSKILTSVASGTAAAVANNKSGERGANMIQALFYPQWFDNSKVKWLGEVQALWYYLDPIIDSSAIYEDSNTDLKLDLLVDALPPVNPFDTKALWRAGKQLQLTADTNRKIYTLIDSSSALTSNSNRFISDNLGTTTPTLQSLMGVLDSEKVNRVNYIRGATIPGYRPRLVSFLDPSTNATTTGEWKLGDIINSTPQVQSSVALNAYHNAYGDTTYTDFIKTNAYKARNVVYAGSNDGMYHAFKLGTVKRLIDSSNIFSIAEMTNEDSRSPNPNIGSEEWAFIPKNALPYIKNQADIAYCHQSLVDGVSALADVSINNYASCKIPGTDPPAAATNYWDCERKVDSWRTVTVGSMGLGGASRDRGDGTVKCNETYEHTASNPAYKTDCVLSPMTGVGLSSYFALDVTDPLTPAFKWEFSDASIAADASATAADKGLGFTTPGAAIIRVSAVYGGKTTTKSNGHWFAVMASGPTGAIDSGNLKFTGHSDQNLKIYIVDLNATMPFTKGVNYWVKDTGIPYAFANSLSGAAIDLDRWSSLKDGYYSDDVVYVTYTKASLVNAGSPPKNYPASATAWNKGGVLRLLTNNNPDPSTWVVSSLIGSNNDVGPITTSVGRMQNRNTKKLWVYFGEGRYFFPGDEMSTQRKFFGVEDPCYKQYSDSTNYALGTTVASCPEISIGDLQDQTAASGTPAATLDVGKKGWYVNMAAESGAIGAERVVSDVTAAFNGTIFYTTFIPNLTDVCQPGGSTSMWAVKYDTGGTPSVDSMQGKAPIQTSSGGIKLIDLATAFTERGNRKLAGSMSPVGMAPKGKFPPLLPPRAAKRIISIQEQ